MLRTRRKLWSIVLVLILGGALLVALLATSSRPWVSEPRTPTAEQIEAARVLLRQARESRETGRAARLTIGEGDLASVAALLSQGFAPYRVEAVLIESDLRFTVSRPVLFRWVNMRAELSGRSRGFPPLRLTIGSVTIPHWLSGPAIEIARLALRATGADVPPLDTLVHSTDIDTREMRAAILLPNTGLIDQVTGDKRVAVDGSTVAAIYCNLARRHRTAPEPLLSGQIARAMEGGSGDGKADAGRDGAAMVALAMLTVDPSVGHLVDDAEVRSKGCVVPAIAISLHGRADLAQHWALSAALTVVTGGRLAAAIGEWKELADSLTTGPYLAADTRTGFSFVDLAADRAGYLTATALMDPKRAAAVRARLSESTDHTLLPSAALAFDEGLDKGAFLRRFGATDDPRYQAEVRKIDSLLINAGVG